MLYFSTLLMRLFSKKSWKTANYCEKSILEEFLSYFRNFYAIFIYSPVEQKKICREKDENFTKSM